MLILVFIAALIFNQLLVYGISQAKGQLKIVMNAVPVTEVLEDTAVADSVKYKLEFIQDVRSYAFDSLGIERNENYTTFYDQKQRPLLWVLSAAEPFELKAYQWTFPVVGKVGYKGFFNWNRALIERSSLKEKGYDTDLSTAGGWSTLGYFKDPVLSQMLRHNEGMLAELIIHELTHGTLYVKSDVTFNENLASFIGEHGAEMYLDHRYGKNSEQLRQYLAERNDHKLFSSLALKYSRKLDSLYKTEEKEMERKKRDLIFQFVSEVKRSPFANQRFKTYARKAYSSGNAFFLSYVRYDSKLGDFQKELDEKYKGDLRAYLAALKLRYGKH